MKHYLSLRREGRAILWCVFFWIEVNGADVVQKNFRSDLIMAEESISKK